MTEQTDTEQMHYDADGWAYSGAYSGTEADPSKRLFRWFTTDLDPSGASSARLRIWAPNLKRIGWIEALRWRLVQSQARLYERIAALTEQIRLQGGVAHARPIHEYKLSEKHPDELWWQYEVRRGPFLGKEETYYHFKWVKEPSEKLLPELGEQLYYLSYTLGMRRRLCVMPFAIRAIMRALPTPNESIKGLERFQINGREYVFEVFNDRWNGWDRRLVWAPESIAPMRVVPEVVEGRLPKSCA
jgi:hypothetical protein